MSAHSGSGGPRARFALKTRPFARPADWLAPIARAVKAPSPPDAPLPTGEIADGVWAIGPWGFTYTVVYLVHSGADWTLVDAGWAGDGPRVEAAVATVLGEKKPQGIVLTHVHPDHEGDARALAPRWRCPVWVTADELPVARRDFERMRATAMPLDRWLVLPMMRLLGRSRRDRVFAGATLVSVARELDPAGAIPGMPDWVAVPTPGHTAGHLSLFRPHDRVLLSGDAMVTARIDTVRHLLLRQHGLSGPPWYTTWDAEAARRSIQCLADLSPNVIGSGHGRAMSGPGTAQAVRDFAQRSRREPPSRALLGRAGRIRPGTRAPGGSRSSDR